MMFFSSGSFPLAAAAMSAGLALEMVTMIKIIEQIAFEKKYNKIDSTEKNNPEFGI